MLTIISALRGQAQSTEPQQPQAAQQPFHNRYLLSRGGLLDEEERPGLLALYPVFLGP